MPTTTETVKCERFHRALCDCHKRIPAGPTRDSACRHLNRSLAQCLVSVACPSESEAVRSLCSSGGTSLKRSQCQQAQVSLSVSFVLILPKYLITMISIANSVITD
ncbi:hypothetical protein MKW94_009294 [Papaver nudicaule]|uniref:COX assembly mitochondrial protein n=1 Tax=Papaver nudicaule TaxID=74823 RepID=A0AA41S7L0_PAPNU|nr:hypothetical protein [Papaver nudicaule]